MGLGNFENRLERMVDGVFTRMFRSGVKPVELGRRLVREMDLKRSIGVRGVAVAPNNFDIKLSPGDFAELEQMLESLQRELRDAARGHAREEGYSLVGPVEVTIEVDESMRNGMFVLTGHMVESEGGKPTGIIELPTGQRVVLGEFIVTIGRMTECTITLHDANVSRNHAEIRPTQTGFELIDLGSTNGTLVNGQRIVERELCDGDAIAFGATTMVYSVS